MNLSQHFTLAELVASDIAVRHGIDNAPPPVVLEDMKRTAALMEHVRTLLCVPIYITSGYRSSAVNKLAGSKAASKHVQGLACDFKAPAYGDPLAVCKAIAESEIVFDQLILEFYNPTTGAGWTHVGLGKDNRRQVLTINNHGTFSGLQP